MARAWIDGFLAGSEPTAYDMYGPSVMDDDDDPRWDRWRQALAEYRRTGTWPHEAWRPPLSFPDGLELPPFVWTLVGDEVWRWRPEGRWAIAEPQPARRFGVLVGTQCADLSEHDTELLTTAHLICLRYGLADQVLPDGLTEAEFDVVRYTYVATPVEPEV